MRLTCLVLSALLVPLAGCVASKPATDLTYVDVRPDRISDQIFLADSIAAAEGCEPPFADVWTVLGRNEAEINEIAKPLPVLDLCAQARNQRGLGARR